MPTSASDPSSFDRLHPEIRRWIRDQGWTGLRPIQDEAIRTVLGSEADVVIMAGTASGKTEAAFLPLLTRAAEAGTGGLRILYVSPLKAPLNDQPRRLELLCERPEMPVTRWPGDARAAARPLPLPSFEGFEFAGAFSTLFEVPLHVALDNFSEHEHFPAVHVALGWTEDDWPKVRFEANTAGDASGAVYVGPQRPSPLLPSIGVRPGDLFHSHFVTNFDPLRAVCAPGADPAALMDLRAYVDQARAEDRRLIGQSLANWRENN